MEVIGLIPVSQLSPLPFIFPLCFLWFTLRVHSFSFRTICLRLQKHFIPLGGEKNPILYPPQPESMTNFLWHTFFFWHSAGESGSLHRFIAVRDRNSGLMEEDDFIKGDTFNLLIKERKFRSCGYEYCHTRLSSASHRPVKTTKV